MRYRKGKKEVFEGNGGRERRRKNEMTEKKEG